MKATIAGNAGGDGTKYQKTRINGKKDAKHGQL